MTSATALLVAFLTGAVGVGGALLIVLAAHPEKVQLWGAMIWGLLRRVTKRAEYAYVASDVAGHINAHLAREVLPGLAGMSASRVAVRWDNSAEAVAREVEGTLIVRLRPHEDRLTNILNAYLVAAPRLFAPTIRSQLSATRSRAIDLQLCRKLAESLSQSAVTVYRLDILDPSTRADGRLAALLEELNAIDLGGLFVPVLLQELVKLGVAFPADSLPQLDYEVRRLVAFLRTVAERARGEDVELSFLGQYIRIDILLVARPETRAKGVHPYRSRIGIELAKGIDTVYVMSAGAQVDFAREVVSGLDGDRRLLRRNERQLLLKRNEGVVRGIIVPFERNLGYSAGEYLEHGARTGEFVPGSVHDATITDVQPSYVSVDINGVQGIVPLDGLSWRFVQDCRNEVAVGDVIQVSVVSVKPEEQELVVSRRKCLPNPFTAMDPSTLRGTRRTFVVAARGVGREGRRFLAGYLKDLPAIPARLYEDELEWGAPLHGVNRISDGEEIDVLVHDVKREAGYAVCSRKRLGADRWDQIRSRYPRNATLRVTVLGVRPNGVWCDIEPGLVGFIPESEFRQAGLEYADFLANVRPGQDLYVYVSRVVAGQRQRITLGLQRNLRGGSGAA